MRFSSSRPATAKFAAALVLLLVWIMLAVSQETGAAARNISWGGDYAVYAGAAEKAFQGQDPYRLHDIGFGYLYPPPSLFVIQLLRTLFPAAGSALAVAVAISLGCGLLSLALLAGRQHTGIGLTWRKVYASCLLLTSAGMLETIERGQINTLVIFLIAGFLWARTRERFLLACTLLAVAVCLKLTPLLFALLFLTKKAYRWLFPLGAMIMCLFLAAEALIPTPGLTASFLHSLRWASGQPALSPWNASLSAVAYATVHNVLGLDVRWSIIHGTKIVLLALTLAWSYAVYVARGERTPRAENSLIVTCNVCMVLAPNIVWLHHAALLIPAIWILLVESRSRLLELSALTAIFGIQMLRYYQWHWARPDPLPFAAAQAILLGACVFSGVLAWRTSDLARCTSANP